MSERDFSPLSAACVRALNDRVYDKRRAAAMEVEKMTRDFVNADNRGQIRKLIHVLGQEMALCQNSNMRKGGLIGLASMAIALGKDIEPYAADMITPILSCVSDPDSRVRFYAIESLFNVIKVAREHVIPIFNEVFISVGTAVTDLDQNTRLGVESLDKLLKDIITESKSFELSGFIQILRERMYTTDPFARSYHLGWIEAIDKIPNSKMVDYLPDFIDAVFIMLGDPQQDIYTKSEKVLGQFLSNIKAKPEDIDFTRMINVLITHSQSNVTRIQIMAVFWIKEFIVLSGFAMLPFASGILMATLPNNSFDDDKRRTMSDEEYKEIKNLSQQVNGDMMRLVKSYEESTPDESMLELSSVLQTLLNQLQGGKVETKPAALRWLHHLFSNCPQKMSSHVDEVFPVLLKTLSEYSDEVVILDLQVLAEICSAPADARKEHFSSCIRHLLRLFRTDRKLLDSKGSFIVRQLCLLLNPEDIFRTMADYIAEETSLPYARHLVDTLNMILLTAPELNSLRQKLKELNSKDDCDFFCGLYKSWSHSPTATIAICFLSGCFGHAGDVIRIISEQPVTVDMLLEFDRLIQLLESPIFSCIRMQLLEVGSNEELLFALYALLMLMPQSTAYKTLQNRLASVPNFKINRHLAPKAASKRGEINFSLLMEHFKEVLDRHYKDSEDARLGYLRSKGVKVIDIPVPIVKKVDS